MTQEISSGRNTPATEGTESLIKQVHEATHSKRITLNASFLDDEKLSDSERVTVLKEVFHRNIRSEQLTFLAKHISPVLDGDLPSNLLIYGPSGTGKSVTSLHFLSSLHAICARRGIDLSYIYVDLTTPRTCFGALNELAIALDGATRLYRKGIALEHMQETVIRALSGTKGTVCILVDEVDNVTTKADLFYTFLAKMLPKKIPGRLFYLFLTNRLEWEKALDPRILSVLKKTDFIFRPYDADDMVKILDLRVEKALDTTKVDPGAIQKIAAYAARENGDARKAVELLVKAVKVAEEASGRLREEEVDTAERMVEIDKSEELISALALQQKRALQACYAGLQKSGKRTLTTGQAYQFYQEICQQTECRALTQRRFSDMVSYFDIYGLINATVISKGRYGKTRELSPTLPPPVVETLLEMEV